MSSSFKFFQITSFSIIFLSVFLIAGCGGGSGSSSSEPSELTYLSDDDYLSSLLQKSPVDIERNQSQEHNLEVEVEFKRKAGRDDEDLLVTVVIDTDSSGDETADDLRFEVLLSHFCYTLEGEDKCVLSVRDEYYLAGYRETRGSYYATIEDRMSYGAGVDDDSLRVRFSLESILIGNVSRAIAQSKGAFSVTVQRLSGENVEQALVLSEDRIPNMGTLEIVNGYVLDPVDDYSGNFDSADIRAVRIVNRFYDDDAVFDRESPENFVNQNPIARLEELAQLSQQYLSGLELDQSLSTTSQDGRVYSVDCNLLGHHTETGIDVCINYGNHQESFSPLFSEDFDFVYIIPPKTSEQLDQVFEELSQQDFLPVIKNELLEGEHMQRVQIDFSEPLQINRVGLTGVAAECRISRDGEYATDVFNLIETNNGNYLMPANYGFDLRQAEYSLSCSLSGTDSNDNIRQTGEIIVYEFTVVENVTNVVNSGNCGFCDGIVVTSTEGRGDNYVLSIAEDDKDRIVVAGKKGSYADMNAMLLRYLESGEKDESFSGDGFALLSSSDGDSQFNDLFVQSDNKILAAGILDDDLMIVRYLENGELDTSFGEGGRAIIEMGLPHFTCQSLIGLEDGSVLVAGSGHSLENGIYGGRMAIAKLSAIGELDTEFGDNGVALLGSSDFFGPLKDLLITESNKIVLAIAHHELGAAILQLTESGEVDTSFGKGEFEGVQVIENLTYIIDIEAAEEGGFMLLGEHVEGVIHHPRVVKLDRDGERQNLAGEQHYVSLSNIYDVEVIKLLSDGNYAILGSSGRDLAVQKIDQTAAPVTSFASNGMIVLDLEYYSAWGKDVHELSDGSLVVGANVSSRYYNEPLVLLKLQANGQLYSQ